MARRPPHRYVPTLTEVVQPGPAPSAAPAIGPPEAGGDGGQSAAAWPAAATTPGQAPPAPALSEEELVQRVMRRVDAALERRLREAIADLVTEQTRALGPVLREEIESLVREALAEAFDQEIGPGSHASS